MGRNEFEGHDTWSGGGPDLRYEETREFEVPKPSAGTMCGCARRKKLHEVLAAADRLHRPKEAPTRSLRPNTSAATRIHLPDHEVRRVMLDTDLPKALSGVSWHIAEGSECLVSDDADARLIYVISKKLRQLRIKHEVLGVERVRPSEPPR